MRFHNANHLVNIRDLVEELGFPSRSPFQALCTFHCIVGGGGELLSFLRPPPLVTPTLPEVTWPLLKMTRWPHETSTGWNHRNSPMRSPTNRGCGERREGRTFWHPRRKNLLLTCLKPRPGSMREESRATHPQLMIPCVCVSHFI